MIYCFSQVVADVSMCPGNVTWKAPVKRIVRYDEESIGLVYSAAQIYSAI